MLSSKNKKKPLRWTATAIKNRLAVWDYIAISEQSSMIAALVDARILQAANRLMDFPESGKPYGSGLRIVFITKTSLALVYRDTFSFINILRISHQKKKIL
jgi:toxin ParE1/3/4